MIFEEKLLKDAFAKEHLTDKQRHSITNYLTILKNRDEDTYRHSIRVGCTACEIARVAEISGVSTKMLLWAGLLHDIGKSLLNPELLHKTTTFTAEDYREMEPHVEFGWRLLERVHDFTAHIIVRHHQFGPRPYPAKLPPLPAYMSAKRELIEAAARLLSLADYYDALMTRRNAFAVGQKRDKYMRDNADQQALILRLEEAGVLVF
jgi:putative nucleotidyltransferase with HDIG domain